MPHVMPSALAAIAQGRDHITTAEIAKALTKSEQTIRNTYAVHGHCYGIRPVKIGGTNRWPVAEVAALLSGGAK